MLLLLTDIDAAAALLLGHEIALMITDKTRNYLLKKFVNNEINQQYFSGEMNVDGSEVWVDNLLTKLNS